MKKLYVIAILILLKSFSYGQQKLPMALDNDTSKYKYPPLWVIQMPNKNIIKLLGNVFSNMINPNLIDSIRIIKNGIKEYGNDGRYGVVEITYRKNVDTTIINPDNLTQLLIKYKLNKKSKRLPVYVDSILVIHPENAYIEPGKLLSIKIEKEKTSGVKFIDILTTNPPKKYTTTTPSSTDKIMIRGTASNQ
jgi:hypothetical protein